MHVAHLQCTNTKHQLPVRILQPPKITHTQALLTFALHVSHQMLRKCSHVKAGRCMCGPLTRADSRRVYASQHLRDAEAIGGAPLVVEQHLRHILGQRDRNLYHAQVIQEPAWPPGSQFSTGSATGQGPQPAFCEQRSSKCAQAHLCNPRSATKPSCLKLLLLLFTAGRGAGETLETLP